MKGYLAYYGAPGKLRLDNDTDYTNKKNKKLSANNKIKWEHTVSETPEQNGVAERYIQTVAATAQRL